MERFFTPVLASSEDEVKIHKHYQPVSHPHPHNYLYHHGSHSHSSSSSHEKHGDHHHDNQHHPDHHRYTKVAGDHHGFTKTSSSSLSSSSSPTSSASWTSEPSVDDETYLMYNKRQHSLSCSNIREDFAFDDRDQLHPQNQQQRHSLENSGQLIPRSQHGHRAPKLYRDHSKSEEGIQQNRHRESNPIEHETLYKTASLAFGENTLGGRGAPKKAVSSIQLPSKSILKNKDERQNKSPVRKSKSMEALSTTVHVTQTSKQSSTAKARNNDVKGKIQFSAFLDEITRQVISPSILSSLGVTAPTPPKSPNEEPKQCADKPKRKNSAPLPKQQLVRAERPDLGKTAVDSSTGPRSHKKPYLCKQHQNFTGPPTPPPRRLSKAERRATSDKQHYRQYSQLLTDGTSTSPEPNRNLLKHKPRHQSSQGPARHLHSKQEHKDSSLPLLPSPGQGSSTSASSDKSDKHMGHRKHFRTHRDSTSAVDTVQVLEEYNRELHENLLQMVSCIENMEAELHCTKTELANFKEKYRRLQESYSVSQQSNSILEQKLKSMVDSLDSERKFLMERVVDLSDQLDAAQKTISSLENINVPSLFRELLRKPFDSREALENFLDPQTILTHCETDQSERAQEFKGSQLSSDKMEERVFGCSDSSQRLSAAFLLRKHDHDPWTVPESLKVKANYSQRCLSVADGVSIYKAELHTVAMPTNSCDDDLPNPHNLKQTVPKRQTGGDFREVGPPVTARKDHTMLEMVWSPAHEGKEKDMVASELAEGKQ
ncbi:uncharacterized protein [Misgurnus anguillicaudatus]|uniref:uncharacterized protein n=1 Tax=Misgurnus anguillicaudatus TaxID=75329 RepID=UPI003CCF0A4B